MFATHALAALAVFTFPGFVRSQPVPDTFTDGMMDDEWAGFDLTQIPFGRSCTPGTEMGPMGGDMMGGDMRDGDMRGRGDTMGGDMMGRGGMMQHHNIPCLQCGCLPADDYGMEHQVRCHLMPGGQMCSMLEHLRMNLTMKCEPGTDMPMQHDLPCGCSCNEDGRWECRSTAKEGEAPNSDCLFLLNRRFIESPPVRVRDLSVLYPQHCETSDGEWVLHGKYKIHDNCNVCLCVDGIFKCKQKMDFCDENGMLNQETVACSDRSGPVFPFGTYTQNGPRYRMCVFGWWMDSVFTAAMKKPGRCPRMDRMEMHEMGDKPTCEEGKVHKCIHDIHCQGKMKCCFKACGGECVMPEFPVHDRWNMTDHDRWNMTDGWNITDGMEWEDPEGMDWENPEGINWDWEKPDRENPDGMDWDMDEHMRPMACNLTSGERIPSGRVYHPSECETCVCIKGETKCYQDENCGKPPTCSCGPPGTDMADMPRLEIPYGTIWHTGKCAACVCLEGDWQCMRKDMCKPSVPAPRSCHVSETHNMSVPTGHTSANGCCVCINGLWTCDSPDCNKDEQFQAQDCTMRGITVRNGAFKMMDCKLCVCANGKEMCSDLCMNDMMMMDKMKDKRMDMMDRDICQQPLEKGPCEALFYHWGYDNEQGKCVEFEYGGCEGNKNNFDSEDECQRRCEASEGMMEGGMPMRPIQDMMIMHLKGMCPDKMFQCPAERMDFCTNDADCEMPGSTCCTNGCFKFCNRPNPDGTPMECPAQECPSKEHDDGEVECNDDSDCQMEGTVCCRDWHGCYGKCVMTPQRGPQPPKEGMCPLHDPPPRFDRIPFPWEDMKKMMMMMMRGGDGMQGGWSGGMGDMPPMDGVMPPMPPLDGAMPPMPPPDGDKPPMSGGMGGEWGDMGGDWADMWGGRSGEWGRMSGEWGDEMGGGIDPFLRWFLGDCSMDSDCDGDMKCCGHFHKRCTEPLEQKPAAQCKDSAGELRDHGYVQIGERVADYDFCLTCMCVDGQWLCQKLTCLEESPIPTLANCSSHMMMGQMVPTGTGKAKQCMAIACFNGHWLKRPLAACVEAKKGKHGMCPRMDGNTRRCSEDMSMPQCRIDNDCSGDMKCCFDGCTLSCADPQEVRSGVCPRPTIMEMVMQGPCEEEQEVDMCLTDEECPDEDKCCYNGCHRTCEESKEMDKMAPGCIAYDPADPDGLPFMSGQIIQKGECDICVCLGTEWMCTDIQDCTDMSRQLPCPVSGKGKTVPSGTLHPESCLLNVCLNGEWHQKLSPKCCPMAPKPCMVDGTTLASGTYMANPETCDACICLHGFMVCKKIDPKHCTNGKVNVPSCWAGKAGEMEYFTGEMKSMKGKKCTCLFGDWRCGSFADLDKERDMKPGVCSAVFDFVEEHIRNGNMSRGGNDGMRMDGMGMGGMGMGGTGMMDRDMAGGRMGSGMWDERGLPERSMDRETGGLFETVRDWLAPPDMMWSAEGNSGRQPDGGMGGGGSMWPMPGDGEWPTPDRDDRGDGDRSKPDDGEGWPMPGDGGWPTGDGEGWPMPGDGGWPTGEGGGWPMPGDGGWPTTDGEGWPLPGDGGWPTGEGGGWPMPGDGGWPTGGGEGEPMPAAGGWPAGGGEGWPMPGDGGAWPEPDHEGGRSKPDDGRGRMQSGRGSTGMDYMMSFMSHIHMVVEFVQKTRFDGCRMDEDCDGDKICCGSHIGGACVKPDPKEALPLPCEYEGEFSAHGTLHQGEQDGMCKACACVHGMWQCDPLDCEKVDEGLAVCPVGTRETGLTVPSGAQQFLQCQMCVCLNGDWKCSDRVCSNKESDALCPAHLPPNIYVGESKCENNMDCEEKEKCCEYKNYGKVCAPKLQRPNERNGECPAEIDGPCDSLKECLTDTHCPGMMKCCRHKDVKSRCDIGVGRGVCVKPSGDHCPGGVMSFTPCGDVNPCDQIGECSSDSSLTCQVHECGSCKAMFFDQNWMPAKCQAHASSKCEIPRRGLSVPAGHAFDDPRDPCQICVCNGNGDLYCTEDRKCGKQKRLKMKFKSKDCSALDDEMQKMALRNEIRSQVAAFLGIDALALKDIHVECGSYLVSLTVVEDPIGGKETVDLDAVTEKLKNAEEVILVFNGEEHSSVPGSVEEVRGRDGKHGHKVMIIAPVVGVIVVVLIIAVTVCWVKSSKRGRDGEKA
ncbi:uncharacterized protein [Amphiura filiformis]|uniref:uncharacterized protein isoform X2 n=1 Tax=Amphiura filiformis TaxID=82378 RepID=UPI003B20C554